MGRCVYCPQAARLKTSFGEECRSRSQVPATKTTCSKDGGGLAGPGAAPTNWASGIRIKA